MGMPVAVEGPDSERALLDGLVRAIAAFRWAAWVWLAVVVVIDVRNGPVAHPAVMLGLAAAALAVTVVATVLARIRPDALLEAPAIGIELALGVTLVTADHWVYGPDSSHAQSLGTIWPLAGVLTAGVRFGPVGGLAAGAAMGVGAWVGELAVVPGRWYGDRILGSLGTLVLYGLGGTVAGITAARLRDAQRRISLARAREEVARTLHDGVLQTLAVVQRRSDDADLVALARDQELELRQYLAGPVATDDAPPDLATGLRSVARRAERTHGLRTELVLAPDLPALAPEVVAAITGATAEALTNAAKHGGAGRATVFVDLDDDEATVCCSIKDAGTGFDPAAHVDGVGLTRSVRGRLADVGGTVEVEGRPGRGTEVRLHAPVAGRTLLPDAGGR